MHVDECIQQRRCTVIPTATTTQRSSLPSLSLGTRVYAAVLQQGIWPLMNIANRRSIHKILKYISQSQWWSRQQLEALQLNKLRQLLEHAYQNVPFYQREMARRGLRPESFITLDCLKQLPIVTKAMLKATPDDFLAKGCDFLRLVTDSTSGSTNEPTKFFRSRSQDSWHWAIKYRMWGMAGYELGLPYVNIYNMPRSGWKKRIQDALLRNNAFYLFADGAQEEMLARALRILARPNMRFLAGCTTSIRVLADYRATLSNPSPLYLQAILSTGSLLTTRERNLIETHLEAPMWDHYGLGGEGAHVAAECELKSGYHINSENLIVEPAEPACVDTDDATEVYVTQLDNYDWPLIRYVSGDRAVFTTRECSCGRGLPLLERIDGRVSEVLTLPNGVRLNTHYFSVILATENAISQYQVEQTARDLLLLRVVWRDYSSAEHTKKQIANEICRVADGTVSVDFEDVSAIAPLPSGKHRFLIALPESDVE